MLGGLRDDVASIAVGLDRTDDGEVVTFCRAGSEDDLASGSADQLRHLGARGFDGLIGGPSKGVAAAGSVAVDIGEEGHHRLEHARIDARGGVIIHIDGELHRRTACFEITAG